MMKIKTSWKDISIKEKIQYSLAIAFGSASIAIGFLAFLILLDVPGSVIGISGLWASSSLACIGISLYFKNEMVEFNSQVKDKLDFIDQSIDKIKKYDEQERNKKMEDI